MSTAAWITIVVFLVLMFLKVPVFVSVMAGTCTYLALTPTVNGIVVVQKIITGMSSLTLLAIPFFIFSGVLMNSSGITRRIMNLCVAITGRFTGSLAQVNVLLSTMMGGLSGSNLADAAMEAKLLVPEMEERGYTKEFSSVVTAVSAMITPLIPPGIGMIVYGSLASASVGRLFTAGISVGLVLMAAMLVPIGGMTILLFYDRFCRHHTAVMLIATVCETLLYADIFPLLHPLLQAAEPLTFSCMLIYIAYHLSSLNFIQRYDNITYGLFLYHFPVSQIFVSYGWAAEHFWLSLLAVAVITSLLAMLSWRLIEQPLIKRYK